MLFKQTQHILPDNAYTCFIIPALFSKEECEYLLSDTVKSSFEQAIFNYPSYYRNNERFVTDNEDLANELFEKVKPYIPETIEIKNSIPAENGIWKLQQLNSRIRFCKYAKNQYFHRHLDGVHYRSETVQSKLTFMVYLNDTNEFSGGRTLFYKTKNTAEIWASYIPKQGDLIVFDHNIWHEGEMLTAGEKFVLRSDILYTKEASNMTSLPFCGHLGYIWSLLKFDKNTIISGGRDTKINVWNRNGVLKLSLERHTSSILCIAKLNKCTFISGARNQEILVWKDFKLYKKLQNHSAAVLSLCGLSNTTFASSSGDGTICIATIDGKVLQKFQAHDNWVWKVVQLSTMHLASCSEDGSIKIWNIETMELIQTFQEKFPIISLAFHTKTKQLISGNLEGTLTLRTFDDEWNLHESETIIAHTGIIRTIQYIDDTHFATGGEDTMVKIWNTNGELLKVCKHQNFVQAIELLDSQTLLSASYDGSIKTWEL
jgi:WD40 repeat protein